jgi:hypothetical protein
VGEKAQGGWTLELHTSVVAPSLAKSGPATVSPLGLAGKRRSYQMNETNAPGLLIGIRLVDIASTPITNTESQLD